MQPVVDKFQTFREAGAATCAYYQRLSPAERLEILFQLRATAHGESDATSERLAPIYRTEGVTHMNEKRFRLCYNPAR